MEIRERAVGAVTVLDPVGKLVLSEEDHDTRLKDTIVRLIEQGRMRFVLDLAHVLQADTSGLALLVAAQVTVVKRGGQLKLLNPTTRLRNMFGVTRLNTFFEVFDTEQSAIDSFIPEQPGA